MPNEVIVNINAWYALHKDCGLWRKTNLNQLLPHSPNLYRKEAFNNKISC